MLAKLALAITCTLVTAGAVVAAEEKEKSMPSALNFDMKTLEGKPVNLAEKYEGKVVLLVNVASRCGLTPQYEALQELHEKYADKGLAIVGVPCNQFGKQEPGTSDDIASFCKKNYGVEFDMLAKSNVKLGEPDQCDLYKYLTSKETNPKFEGEIQWNFEKFLFARDGTVADRFDPRTRPTDKPVIEAIEAELAKAAPAE